MSSRPSLLPTRGVYRKFALALVATVCIALVVDGASDIYFAAAEVRRQVSVLQRIEAGAAAARVSAFVEKIVGEGIRVASLPPEGPEVRTELQHLLRRVPAISHVTMVDAQGHEQIFVSRFELDAVGNVTDYSAHDGLQSALRGTAHFGSVYFRRETEPYMTIALPVRHGRGGVLLLDVNLKSIWEVIRSIRVGTAGHAYVVDRDGILVAHPNISRVLGQENLRNRSQVAHALAALASGLDDAPRVATDGTSDGGEAVLSAFSRVPGADWLVFVEQSVAESYRPIDSALWRTLGLLFVGLAVAVAVALALSRRMVAPVAALSEGARKFAEGDLQHRIDVRSGDELQEVAQQLNQMADQLREAQSTLERRVEERTRELEAANRVKAKFLAAAGHDLRQPVHALGLLISSLRLSLERDDLRELAEQADRAIDTLRELLDNLLDMSRLEAGIVKPSLQDFPLNRILEQAEFAYAPEAAARGLDLRVVRSGAWVRSDPVMMGRILRNLVANAVRNTEKGRVLLGARRGTNSLSVEVWDTGIGIAPQHIETVFQEFVRLEGRPDSLGLGLGLAIVRGLAEQLGHRLDVHSQPGRGSVFRIHVPQADRPTRTPEPVPELGNPLADRVLLVVDDDPAAVDAVRRLLQIWQCTVLLASNVTTASAVLAEYPTLDAVLCDHHLGRDDGLDLLKKLRPGPARVLVTGDTDPALQRSAEQAGIAVLHKPVQAGRLRSLLNSLLLSVPPVARP